MPRNLELFLKNCDNSWADILTDAFATLPESYVNNLTCSTDWLPGIENIFNAFSLPLPKVTTILLGESPYPRATSANGYAFWDNAVTDLWSPTGLSKSVNRATSMRNWLKLLLLLREDLQPTDLSQRAISQVNKQPLITTLDAFFDKLLSKGFLLLNASLVLSNMPKSKEAKIWHPFMRSVLTGIAKSNSNCTLLLFGNIAQEVVDPSLKKHFNCICAEHPYNISFIHNKVVQDFFRSLDLLAK